MLNIIDEFTRERLVIKVGRKLTSADVIKTVGDLFLSRGVPTLVRSDNGPEFIATTLRLWFEQLELKPLLIQPVLGRMDTANPSTKNSEMNF